MKMVYKIKKNIKLLLGVVLLLTLFACSDSKKNDLTRMNLFGNVKSVTEIISGIDTYNDSVIHTIAFNKSGNKIIESWSYSDSIANTRIKYFYPDDFTVEQLFFDSQDSLIVKSVYKNNKFKDPLVITAYNSIDSIEAKGVYGYNEKGLLLDFLSHDRDGNVLIEEKYSYDDQGNLTTKDVLEGEESYKYVYGKDSLGNMNKLTVFNSNGVVSQSSSFKYKLDFQRNWIERIETLNGETYEHKKRNIIYY